jgi:uncharacterized protein (TIGR02266 family)
MSAPTRTGPGGKKGPEARRRFRRMTVRLLVDFATSAGPRCEYATTLGAGGLFIESEEPLRPGTPFKVRFRLPGRELLHVIESRVAWWQPPGADPSRAPGMGVEFTDSVAISQLARELDKWSDGGEKPGDAGA